MWIWKESCNLTLKLSITNDFGVIKSWQSKFFLLHVTYVAPLTFLKIKDKNMNELENIWKLACHQLSKCQQSEESEFLPTSLEILEDRIKQIKKLWPTVLCTEHFRGTPCNIAKRRIKLYSFAVNRNCKNVQQRCKYVFNPVGQFMQNFIMHILETSVWKSHSQK